MSSKQSKSILRSASTGKTSNRGVSFATNTNTKSNKRPHNNSGDNGGDNDDDGMIQTNSKMMNDVEEDAFDPSIQQHNLNFKPLGSDCDSMSLKQIREFKSKRALQRVAGQEEIMDATANANSGTNAWPIKSVKGNKGNKNRQGQPGGASDDVFDGEEEVDEHYSLLRDDEAMHEDPSTIASTGQKRNHDKESAKQDACPIEPFNMTSEREDGSGYFDGETYVFRRGKGEEEEDAWLDQLNDNDDAKDTTARTNVNPNTDTIMLKLKQKEMATANNNNNASDKNQLTKEQIYDEIVSLLATDSESIIQALGRYGSIIKRETKQYKQLRKHQNQIQQSQSQEQDQKQQPSASNKALNRLTELCNVCMMKFDDTAIYDHNRDFFMALLQKSDERETTKRKTANGSTHKRSYFDGANAANAKDAKRICSRENGDASSTAMAMAMHNPSKSSNKCIEWEYRGNEDHAIHGPYRTEQMLEWIKAGYFIGPMAVDVRMINAVIAVVAAADMASNVISKEEVVDNLLGDLDSDDEEVEGGERGGDATATEWQRSDQIDFSTYL